MLLLKKCCCFDLRTGCIVTAIVRLVSWVIVLTASVYTCLHVFSPDDRGMFHYRVIVNIEKNGKKKPCYSFYMHLFFSACQKTTRHRKELIESILDKIELIKLKERSSGREEEGEKKAAPNSTQGK